MSLDQSSSGSGAVAGRRFVRTSALPARFGLSASFFNNARVKGDGPPFVKVGAAVLYDLDEVEAWLAARRRQSTSQEGAR